MRIKSTEVVDTFAEAFKMWGTRLIITAETRNWALAAARSMTGFATSVIGCKCEAGIESELAPEQTPDLRPGASVLLFAMDAAGVGKRLVERVGQCVMTCPTTACYNGLDAEQTVLVGGQLRYFGDGFQGSKLLLGKDAGVTLRAARAAVKAMREVPGVILPFPDGVVRSGSKVGSKYKSLMASTNHQYCPTLRGSIDDSALPDNVDCVLEIVISKSRRWAKPCAAE